MPCWPDIWEQTKRELPRIGVFVFATGYLAIVALLLWAPRLNKRCLRISSRILGGVAAIPIVFLGPALLFGILLASGNPPTATRSVYSQSGQEAKVSYNAGFLGRDYTEVTLKRLGCCQHSRVFWHGGPSSLENVDVEWIDDRHLRLTYYARPNDAVHCERTLGEVSIECTSH